MPAVQPLFQDPFAPVLLMSDAVPITEEHKGYIKKVLDRACSDSRFAEKAYAAIVYILTTDAVDVPAVNSLTPATIVLGSPSTTLHVHGANFTPGSIIVFNGFEEPTTFVSDVEITTGINMDVWAAPAVVPVGVLSEQGVFSNTMDFSFTEAAALMAAKTTPPVPPVAAKPVATVLVTAVKK